MVHGSPTRGSRHVKLLADLLSSIATRCKPIRRRRAFRVTFCRIAKDRPSTDARGSKTECDPEDRIFKEYRGSGGPQYPLATLPWLAGAEHARYGAGRDLDIVA